MTAYAVAHLRSVTLGPDITGYLERIDSTLAPFHGRFLVHGAKAEVLEGSWPGDLIILEFPDREPASAWYTSPAYQQSSRYAPKTPTAPSSSSTAYHPTTAPTDILS